MENNAALIVVHHKGDKSTVPENIREKIKLFILKFPKNNVYYTPQDQDEYPLNEHRQIPFSNKNIQLLFFVGCNTMHDACVASQIRLLNGYNRENIRYKNILVKDLLYEDSRVDFLKQYLKDEGYDIEIIMSKDKYFG